MSLQTCMWSRTRWNREIRPGFDLFFTSGITRGLPAIVPIAMLYNTPDDAAAEIAYIEKRAVIPFRTSRWAKRQTANTCCRKTTRALSAVREALHKV